MSVLKIYKNGHVVEKMRLGVTDLGETTREEFELENTHHRYIRITPMIKDKDVKVIECPEGLEPHEKGLFVIEFTHSPDRNLEPLLETFPFVITVG